MLECQGFREGDDVLDADRRIHRGAILVLSAAVLAGFGPGVFGDFLWDDDALIVHNRYVRDWSDLPRAFQRDFWDASGVGDPANPTYGRLYRPVVKVAYLLQFQAFGASPPGWHLVSLGLHLACTLLAYGWLRRRLRDDRGDPDDARPTLAAGLAALLLALHPTRVESVAWVSGATDLWMALFVLLGLRAWDRARGLPGATIAGACFVLGALAKEAAVVVPFVLVADAALRGGRPRPWGRLGVVAGMMAAFLAARLAWIPLPGGGLAPQGPTDAVARVLASLGHFLASTLWPWSPSTQVGRQVALADGGFAQAPWAVALGGLALVGGAVLAWVATRRRGAAPWLADLLWFVGPLVPVLNLFPMGTYTLVSERFLYLPLLGAAAVAARGLAAAGGAPPAVRAGSIAVAGALAVAFLAVVVPHLGHYRDDDALWSHERRLDPDNLVVAQQAATMALRARRFDDAFDILQAARVSALEQRDPARAAAFALGLGTVLIERTPDADAATLVAVRDFLDGFERTGRLELHTGGVDLSFGVPDRVRARLVADPQRFLGPRAAAWARTAPAAQAESRARDWVAQAPHDVAGHVLLGLLLARQGRFEEAAAALDAADRRFPGAPDVALARRRLDTARQLAAAPVAGDGERALRDVRVALALGSPAAARQVLRTLDPGLAAPEAVLVAVQVEVADRRFDAARDLLREAGHRDPDRAGLWQAALDRVAEAEAREARR